MSIQSSEKNENLFDEKYLIKRPILTALTNTESSIFLIDEIDRSDEEFEALLLEILAENQVTIPEFGTINGSDNRVTILTSNSTRELSDALRRRCIYYYLDFPSIDIESKVLMNSIDKLDEDDAKKFLKSTNYPTVIKADNLASGKGVYICNNENEALIAVEEIFNGKFGKAKNLLIEEFLEGEEMSFFTIHDGITFKTFDTAQDHKRVLEGDKGKNTGGMGAYSPSRLINEDLKNKIINKIIKPTLEGLAGFGSKYKGFLYTGLMIVENEPYLIEYNVRMGDPECQTILPKLKTDISEIFLACCEEELNNVDIEWTEKKSLCIVVCSKGYPEEFKKNIEIKNLSKIKLDQDEYLFHAGTIDKESRVFAVGGRVLNFISLSENLTSARDKVINKIDKLNWDEGFYRKDIGYKVIDELE